MKSRILTGQVLHTRLTPVRHRFSYPVYFYSFDLEELPQLAAQTRLFGYNRRAVVSIFDEDYLTPGQVPVKEKLFSILKDQVELDELCSIELITCARYFGYVFNPVSFFMCRDRAGRLRCVLAEVNNTFSETHLYVLDKAEQSKADDLYVFRAAKEFHVSPFYGMDWKYVFRVKDTGKKLAIDIDMVRDAKAEFHARLEGEAAPFGAHELRTTLFRFPFTALLSFPRILAQAAKLYFGKKLPVYQKPAPHSRWTIKTAPATLCQRAAGRVIKKLLQRIETGYLSVELPDQRIWKFGLEGTSPQVRLKIRDYCFFSAVLWDADIGLGESYAAGAWDADDLTAVLELGVLNSKLYYSALLNSRLLILGSTLLHRLRRNTVHGSRRNIAAHYDLSNAFFQTFLDE